MYESDPYIGHSVYSILTLIILISVQNFIYIIIVNMIWIFVSFNILPNGSSCRSVLKFFSKYNYHSLKLRIYKHHILNKNAKWKLDIIHLFAYVKIQLFDFFFGRFWNGKLIIKISKFLSQKICDLSHS